MFVSYSTIYGGKALHSSAIGKNKKQKQTAETIKAGGRMVDFIRPFLKNYSHTTPIDTSMDTDSSDDLVSYVYFFYRSCGGGDRIAK